MRISLLLLLFPFLIVGCESKKEPPPPPVGVTAFCVQPHVIPAEQTFVGVIKSSHPVEIRARVEGYLLSINYVEGAMVNEGDLLFRLDPKPFEADLEEAKGELSRQEAILWRAKRSLDRIEPLFEQNAASQRDLDLAISQVLTAEAAVIEAKANVEKAELNLGYTYVQSPIKGWAGRAIFREGTLITPSVNGLLTNVSVINPIWVDFAISSNELLEGRAEGKQHRLTLPPQDQYVVSLELSDGSTYRYKGYLNFTSPTLDPRTGTMRIRATFSNPDNELLPGQFVNATVSGAYYPDALIVPQASVFQGRRGMYVFVINKDDSVEIRNVQTGAWYKDYWIITEGLKPGDVVVDQGTNKVQNGSHVKVLSMSSYDGEPPKEQMPPQRTLVRNFE